VRGFNPTNGSWWIVQILSTQDPAPCWECHPRQWVDRSDPLYRTCTNPYTSRILPAMFLTPFETLTWAYQLHYYICFRTHRRRQVLPSILKELISEICDRHAYHLLECKSYPAQLRLLVSLRPHQSIAKVIQTIKSNSSRELKIRPRLWARGYFAQSAGKVRISAVRKYLEQQSAHHGYDLRWLPPVYRYRDKERVELSASHAVSI